MSKTIMEQLKELPSDLSKREHSLQTEPNIEDFLKDLSKLSKKYDLYIHNWNNGSGAWIHSSMSDADYDFRWDKDLNKYDYKKEGR